MRKLLILLFAVISLTVASQDAADNQHAYISDEEAARLIKADNDVYDYNLINDSLHVVICNDFIRWPLGDYDTLEGLLTRFENPTVSPFFSERYNTSEDFYIISTPHSETKVIFGQQHDEPEIHSFILIAKILGDVTLSCNIRIGTAMNELFEKLQIPKPHYYTKLTRLTVDDCCQGNRVVFYFDNSKVNRIDIFTEGDPDYGSW